MLEPDPVGETSLLRTGSPFALGTAVPSAGNLAESLATRATPEPIGEGVWRETVAAAGFSAWMLVAFAFVGWSWFPEGGIAISVLGISMSLLGLTSRLLKSSSVALVLHVLLFVACYIKQ